MQATTQPVRYRHDGTAFTGFLAQPETGDSIGRILVVHGGAGLDDHAREQSVRFAELGYAVFACDMYGEGVAGDRDHVMQAITRLRGDRAALRTRVEAGVAAFAEHASADPRYALIGYCFGGLVALEYARTGAAVAGVVSIHGTLAAQQPAGPATILARILVCHGALDPHVPMTDVTGFVTEMSDSGTDWQLNIYGSAMHGFTHRTATTAANGVQYDAAADARSFSDTQRFLAEVLAA